MDKVANLHELESAGESLRTSSPLTHHWEDQGPWATQEVTKWDIERSPEEALTEETARGSLHCPQTKDRDDPAVNTGVVTPPRGVPSPPLLPILQLLMKSAEMGTRMQRQSGFNSFWASARFSLGPGHVSQRWFPWLIYPKSAPPKTLAFVLPVAVSKWGFGWEQYQRDRHYTPIIMKLMGSKSFWLKALTGWDHTRL